MKFSVKSVCLLLLCIQLLGLYCHAQEASANNPEPTASMQPTASASQEEQPSNTQSAMEPTTVPPESAAPSETASKGAPTAGPEQTSSLPNDERATATSQGNNERPTPHASNDDTQAQNTKSAASGNDVRATSTSSPHHTAENDGQGSGSNRAGTIAGSIVGGIVGIALIAGIVLWMKRRNGYKHGQRGNKDGFEEQRSDFMLDMTEAQRPSEQSQIHARNFVPPTGYENVSDTYYAEGYNANYQYHPTYWQQGDIGIKPDQVTEYKPNA